MRHQRVRRRLSRFGSSRKALLNSLSMSLLREDRISTTLARAKELRRLVDKLINLGRRQDLNSRRAAFRLLQDRESVELLFKDVALRFKENNSGYTRIIHCRNRRGDNAPMAIIELTVQRPKEKKPAGPKKKKEMPKEVKKEKAEKEEKIAEVEVKEETRPVAERKTEPVQTEKKIEEKKPAPPARKEKPRGFLDGIRGLFRRKKDKDEG